MEQIAIFDFPYPIGSQQCGKPVFNVIKNILLYQKNHRIKGNKESPILRSHSIADKF